MGDTRPRSILVVDDDESARALLEEFLGRRGWDVVTTASSAEAMTAFEDRAPPFRVLLTDYFLSDGRGDELARALRERSPELAVVYVTGNVDLRRALGAENVLVKPVELDRLAAMLERAVAHDPRAGPQRGHEH